MPSLTPETTQALTEAIETPPANEYQRLMKLDHLAKSLAQATTGGPHVNVITVCRFLEYATGPAFILQTLPSSVFTNWHLSNSTE
jgi:hypothetical protein